MTIIIAVPDKGAGIDLYPVYRALYRFCQTGHICHNLYAERKEDQIIFYCKHGCMPSKQADRQLMRDLIENKAVTRVDEALEAMMYRYHLHELESTDGNVSHETLWSKLKRKVT